MQFWFLYFARFVTLIFDIFVNNFNFLIIYYLFNFQFLLWFSLLVQNVVILKNNEESRLY